MRVQLPGDFAEEIFVKKNTWKNKFSPKFSWSFLDLYIHSDLSIGWLSESYFNKKVTRANFYKVWSPANLTKQTYVQTAFTRYFKDLRSHLPIIQIKGILEYWLKFRTSYQPLLKFQTLWTSAGPLANSHTTSDVSKNS